LVSKEILSQRTADYQNWVEAFARNHHTPIAWAEKGVRKEDHVLPWHHNGLVAATIASGNVSRCQDAHCRKGQGARHRLRCSRRRGDRKMPSRPPLLTLMRSPLRRGRPKWRRWFGVDIKRK
jgi:hypothetical protein